MRGRPQGGEVVGPWPPVNSYQTQIADLQTVKSRYQTGELASTDCRTGNDWKPDCKIVIEGLEGLVTVSLHTTPRSLMAPKGAGGYIYTHTSRQMIYIQDSVKHLNLRSA